MVVFDLVIRLIHTLMVPAACAYLAITAVDAATGNGMLRGLADGIKSLTSGALKLILTLFTAYLTIAGSVSGSVDRMALKTAKFAVSGAVPVVGGVISDATETVLSGASLLKNSIGVFGMLCVTAICLVPFLRAGASYLCYKAGAAVLSPLCSGSLRQLLEGVGTGFGLLLGMLSTCCLILYLELVYVVAMVKLFGAGICGCDGEADMTELFQTILMRVTLAGVASAVALRMVGGGALREIIKAAAGLLMLLALLQPLSGLRTAAWDGWGVPSQEDIAAIQEQNTQTTMSTVAASIAEMVEQRTQKEGFDCTVDVTMANDENGILQVDRVTVYYGGRDAARLEELRAILTEECGVPEERQEMIAR